MKRWGLVAFALAAAGLAIYLMGTRGPGEVTLADPDCSRNAPVMAIDLYGDLRQDDVAVIHRDGRVDRLTDEHASFDASFSPDGSRIVFTSGREGIHEECCGFSDYELYVMNSDGADQRRLMKESSDWDQSPAWSPDGSTIAFARDQSRLMVVPPSGENPREIYKSKLEIKDIEWSPDGERIAFLAYEDIFMIDKDGSNVELFAEGLGYVDDLAWSPDGETLAFSAEFAIHTATLEEPNPRLFAEDAHTPAWSPGGDFLAYYSEEDDDTPKLVTQPADGGDETPLKLKRKDIYSFATNLEWLDCRP